MLSPLPRPQVLEGQRQGPRSCHVWNGASKQACFQAVLPHWLVLGQGGRGPHFTSLRLRASGEKGQPGREQSIIQPVTASSLSMSSWDSDKDLRRNPGGTAGGFCVQQGPQSPAPKGAAAGTNFRAERSCPAPKLCLQALLTDIPELVSPQSGQRSF